MWRHKKFVLNEKCQLIAEKTVKFFHIYWHYHDAFTVGLKERMPRIIGMRMDWFSFTKRVNASNCWDHIMTLIVWGILVVNQSIIQYKNSADIENTLNFSMKQVYCLNKKCCISLYRLGNQYIPVFISLQIQYISIAGLNLDKNKEFGRNFGWKWWFWTDEKRYFGQHISCAHKCMHTDTS